MLDLPMNCSVAYIKWENSMDLAWCRICCYRLDKKMIHRASKQLDLSPFCSRSHLWFHNLQNKNQRLQFICTYRRFSEPLCHSTPPNTAADKPPPKENVPNGERCQHIEHTAYRRVVASTITTRRTGVASMATVVSTAGKTRKAGTACSSRNKIKTGPNPGLKWSPAKSRLVLTWTFF